MQEKSNLSFILEQMKPDLSIVIGKSNNEILSSISKYSNKVYFFYSSGQDKNRINDIVYYDIHTLSEEIDSLNKSNQATLNFIYLDLDKDNNFDNVINRIMEIHPKKQLVILIYNSFNPRCRKKILNVDWQSCSYIHSVEIDFIPGYLENSQMMGGLSLIVMRPFKRMDALVITQSNQSVFNKVSNASVSLEPFPASKILMNISEETLAHLVEGKKIVFFGTGSTSYKLLTNLSFKVNYFVDNNAENWGKTFQGIEIKNPLSLLSEDKNNLAIIIASQFSKEISHQLSNMGFGANHHYWDGYTIALLHRPYKNHYFYDTYYDQNLLQKKSFKVSVIIDDNNINDYMLKERIDSIINQTYNSLEIVFILNHLFQEKNDLIQSLLESAKIPFKIIILNQTMTKWKRWGKAIEVAEGDIIWFAEVADVCRLDFLERALLPFSETEVTLSYVASKVCDYDSLKMIDSRLLYTDDISRTKWLSSYCKSGQDEIIEGLGMKNTIEVSSAVLFRKSAINNAKELLREFEVFGDWFLYLYALRHGKIAFSAENLNYHRMNITSSEVDKNRSLHLQEYTRIKRFILDNYLVSAEKQHKFLYSFIEDYYSKNNSLGKAEHVLLNELEEKFISQIRNNPLLNERERILIVAPDLEVGGGQAFAIRLANFLASFHDVYLYNARPNLVHEYVQKTISSNVYQLPSRGNSNDLAYFIKKYSIKYVNSHVWAADKIVYPAISSMPDIVWVMSMHGCYEALSKYGCYDPSGKDACNYLDFEELFIPVMKRVNQIVYPADKNLEAVTQKYPKALSKMHKAYYGYLPQFMPSKERKVITDNKNEYIFGVLSRATPEKGWEESIQAIIQLNLELQTKHHLVLVGKSDFSSLLKRKYKEYQYIHFIEEFTQPSEWLSWLQIFNVALLPTYFPGESLPNSIIEYLTYEKPIISTNIGEIKNMITDFSTGESAGILLELNNENRIDVKDLVEAMRTMIINKTKYQEYKNNTKVMISKFSMPNCANIYYKLFK